MTLPRLSKWGLLLLCFVALLSSCDNGCQKTRENFLHVAFVSTSGRTLKNLDYIACSDTIAVSESDITSFDDVELDLNPSGDSVLFVFSGMYVDYGDTYLATDSVVITYSTQPLYLDMACGATMLYELKDVQGLSHEFISRISVNNSSIKPDQEEGKVNITFEY